MALMNGLKGETNQLVQLGNRADYCHLCAKEVKGKNEKEYILKQRELVGKLEGKKCIKIVNNGTTISICMEHIHKLATENPIEE